MQRPPSILGGDKSPAVSAGTGAPRTLLDSPPAIDTVLDESPNVFKDTSGNQFLLDALGQKEWSEHATFEGQYSITGMVKRDPPIAEVFNLGEEAQLKAYNNLLHKLDPQNPSVEIIQEDRQFHNGNFIIYIVYNKVWYLLPIKK